MMMLPIILKTREGEGVGEISKKLLCFGNGGQSNTGDPTETRFPVRKRPSLN